ncbi:hypothetical protein GIB67_033534 [Kingdonia uniflora]|uniref:DYW domain-containing protein n=1 Tax=Kingdonia uniflora TaxID=39325 RepID=A0A7J7L6B0_9MAGN|nr:hypothetical protein GIB67_033534 [Kingdonia uniflora]
MSVILATPSSPPPISLPQHHLLNSTKTSKPQNFTPTVSLKLCKTIKEIKQKHGHIIKTCPIQSSPSKLTKLILACIEIATIDSLNYAKKAFELFSPNGDMGCLLFMVNSLIRGYSSIGIGYESLLLYTRMLHEGIVPDKFTYPFLLSGCTKGRAWKEGVQVHGSLVKMGLSDDAFIDNSLIHFYAECGEMELSQRVFDKMSERNVVSWTSLVCGYGRGDCPKEAVELFFGMVEFGVIPNSVTMTCVISACAKMGNLEMCERVYGYIRDCGIGLNGVVVNALVDMYMKCKAVETAKAVFDEATDRNLVLYNTMMSNYVRVGMAEEAFIVLAEMLQLYLRPDKVTVMAIVTACSELGNLGFGRQTYCYILRNGLNGFDSVSNSVIDMYMKFGEPKLALRVFDLMLSKTVVSWNTMIAGFIRNSDMESAFRFFKEMPEKNLVSWNTMVGALVQDSLFVEVFELFRMMQTEEVKADKVTMVGVASACGYLGSLELAKWIHAYIDKNEIQCDVQLSAALVNMYARCGDPKISMQLFDKIGEKDVSAWTTAIGAMGMEGDGRRAVELFHEMIADGVKPDGVAYVTILTACSHSGLLEEGRSLFRSMKNDYGISPQIVHYGCMVDLLGRAGLLEEALELIEKMQIEPNDVIWGTLLAACRTHNNVELATFVADRITKLASERTGIFILLSNIYASAGKWTDMANVRMQLKENGLHKLPGSSSIEVNGAFHEFTSSGVSHGQITHITKMLDEISCRLKDAGHVPDLTNVLLDVDDQEKEYTLIRHSEKLATAFGLISTDQGALIRIVKNLRMCSDCHSFTKLVSEIYNREIVVSDNNRVTEVPESGASPTEWYAVKAFPCSCKTPFQQEYGVQHTHPHTPPKYAKPELGEEYAHTA